MRDALFVLDEIDQRLSVIHALETLSKDKKTNELETLHPLVARARWLFGPQFDSPEFASNMTLRNAVEKVFKERIDPKEFSNPKRRPDLLVLGDGTVCAVSTDEIKNELTYMSHVLLIELKKGGSKIGREEMNQAQGYTEDLLGCGILDGAPLIHAFVVGHELDPRIQPLRATGTMGQPNQATIQATTYGQLVRTAQKRLFGLREKLGQHYDGVSGDDLLKRILAEPKQAEMELK